jgi:glycosyltransferase involved in cell wall biosynthesis
LRVLIFSAFDGVPYTGEEPMRYAAICEEFLKNGHDVIYVSADFSHIHKNKRIVSNPPTGLKLILLPTKAYYNNFSLRRILSHYGLSGTLNKWLGSVSIPEMPDLVIGASPPIFANNALLKFSKRNNIPFIYDIQDLWPEEFVRFLPGRKFFKFLLRAYFSLAENIVKQASGVTAVSKDYLDYFNKQIGTKPSGVFYLGTDAKKYVDVSAAKTKEDKTFKIMMLGHSQAGNYVLEVARAIQSMPDMHLVVAGLKEKTDVYLQKVADEKLERVEIIPWLDKTDLYKTLPGFDAGLILVNPGTKSAFPNRAFAYFAAGLPVISNIRNGELEKMIDDNKLGVNINMDAHSFQTALDYCRQNFKMSDHMRIQEFARAKFSKNNIYEEYYHWAITNFENWRTEKTSQK